MWQVQTFENELSSFRSLSESLLSTLSKFISHEMPLKPGTTNIMPRIIIICIYSVMIHYLWTLYDWLHSFCMATIVGIISSHGLRNEARCRKQPNMSKQALYKPLLHFYSHFEQLYMSNKTERFCYKGGCGMRGCTRIKVINRRAGLGYR